MTQQKNPSNPPDRSQVVGSKNALKLFTGRTIRALKHTGRIVRDFWRTQAEEANEIHRRMEKYREEHRSNYFNHLR